MVENTKTTGFYSASDRLAIALACLAGFMAIVLFLVEKTPLTVVGLLVLMVVLLVYPILHFVKAVNNQGRRIDMRPRRNSILRVVCVAKEQTI